MHDDLEPRRSLHGALHALPAANAAPYDYAEFERRTRARQMNGPRVHLRRGLAAAAVALLAATPILYRMAITGQHSGAGARVDAVLAADGSEAPVGSDLPIGGGPVLVHVGTHAAVVRLQDRIARVDDLLSAERYEGADAAQLLALQQERSRLVGTLQQVRFAEALADRLP